MDSAPPHPPLLPPPDFTLVEIHNLSLPSPASSFNNLRVCLRPDSNFASLSTSLHPSLELTRGSDTPFKLSSADLILKPKKSRKKNKASSTPPAPVPPSPAYTELVVATDVIGGDGTDWETYGTNETALEAIAVQRKEVRLSWSEGWSENCASYIKTLQLIVLLVASLTAGHKVHPPPQNAKS